MRWYTHTTFAVLLALVFRFSFLMGLVCVFGALFVDIDTDKSFMGRILKPIALLLKTIFGHRGIIHSVFLAIVLSGIIWIFSFNFALAFLVGYLSHLLLDSLTKEGVRLFYPFKFRLKWFAKTGGLFELFLFLVFVVLILIVTIVTGAGKVFINVF